jgi:hypothetical protein
VPLGTYLNGSVPSVRRIGLLWLALSESGNVLTATSVTDAGGGSTQSWVAGSAVACRIDPVGGSGPGQVAERVDERSTHVVTVPPGTVVSTNSRFAITGRGTFDVTATRDQTGEHATIFEVIPAA